MMTKSQYVILHTTENYPMWNRNYTNEKAVIEHLLNTVYDLRQDVKQLQEKLDERTTRGWLHLYL